MATSLLKPRLKNSAVFLLPTCTSGRPQARARTAQPVNPDSAPYRPKFSLHLLGPEVKVKQNQNELQFRQWNGGYGVFRRAGFRATISQDVGLGANAYAQDVAIIETEMVDTANWIRDHTPPAALIAAHDIGALGYFGERKTLDLAGLTSSQAIPILRDEAALRSWIDGEQADYLMTFPGWYPQLSAVGAPVYISEGEFSPASGGENMVVYAWPGAQDFSP